MTVDAQLEVSAVIPDGASIELTVYEDTDKDGVADNQETVQLSDGQNNFTLTELKAEGSNDYWIEPAFTRGTDPEESPYITENSVSLTVEDTIERAASVHAQTSLIESNRIFPQFNLIWNDNGIDWDQATDEEGVVHEDVANTVHDNAAVLKQGYSAEDPYLTQDLLVYLPMHEESGTTAYDFSGNGNHGDVQNGPTQGEDAILGTNCYRSTAASQDERIAVPNLGGTVYDEISMSVWFTLDGDLTDNNDGLAGAEIQDAQDPSEYLLFWGDETGGDNTIDFYCGEGDYDRPTTGHIPGDDEWHLITGAIDNTGSGDGDAYLYFDGQQVDSSPTVDDIIWPDGEPFGVMDLRDLPGSGGWRNESWSGRVCEFRMYNRTLTLEEHQFLYDVVAELGFLETASKEVTE